MAELKIDPFISTEPEVELDDETRELLHKRMKSADAGNFVSEDEARKQIHQWLTNSSTSTKP